MNLKVFLSVLLVYRSNFQLIHWKACGKQFDRIHKLAADNYDKLLADADQIAEYAMRVGLEPVNYMEALKELNDYKDHDFKILKSDENYDLDSYIENLDIMYKDITTCIEQLLETELIKSPANVGIKAGLEAMHDTYDLELRYLNKRRGCDD